MPIFIPAEYSSEVRGALGVFLAMKHLNSGDGSVIPEIEGLNNRCNIRFTTEIFDTEASERVALNKLVDLTRRKPAYEQLPCAILGGKFAVYLLHHQLAFYHFPIYKFSFTYRLFSTYGYN